MNDFERYHHRSPLGSLPHHYAFTDRSLPMSFSHAMRQDIRQCPVTRQNRNISPPSVEPEPDTANGQPRRRIAVACARCRKRKIRCSGDPGNNTGCQNCRAAGADINQCQFNRVGSYVPTGPVYNNYSNGVASSPNLPLSNSFHGSTGSYPPHDKGILMTRAYQPYNSVAYSDDSPIESYGYQTPAPMSTNDVYGTYFGPQDTLRQWNTMDQKPAPTSNGMYLDQTNQGSYSSVQLPYLSAPVTRQPAVTTDSMSVFSMNSLQSSLMPATASIPSSLETRHLPVPTATRMPASQIQTAELPLRTLASSAVHNNSGILNGSYTKAAMGWSLDNNAQDGRQTSSNGNTSELMPAPSLKSSTSSMQDSNVVNYIPITTASPDSSTSSGSGTVYTPASNTYTPGSVPLDEKFPAVRTPPPPETTTTSAVREDAQSSLLSRPDSSSNLYSYSTAGSSKRNSRSGEQSQTEGALVSGQRYAPLSQPQPQHNVSIGSLRRSSFEDARRRSSIGRL